VKRAPITNVRKGHVAVAYQVLAEDPKDLVYLGGNIEVAWESTGCSTLGDE
jgi:hypothetical protein